MSHDPVHTHRSDAPASVACWVLTISDTRTPETDRSGKLIREVLEEAGHRVVGARIVKDEPSEIRSAVEVEGRRANSREVVPRNDETRPRRSSTRPNQC